MAEYTWEVDSSNIVLKEGSTTLATINGGIDYTAILGTDDSSVTLTSGQMEPFMAITTERVTEGTATPGVITLKKLALNPTSSTAISITPATSGAYKLGLEGVEEGGTLTGDATPAGWEAASTGSEGTAKYVGAGTAATWTVEEEGAQITATAQVNGTDIATLNGLKKNTPIETYVTVTEPVTEGGTTTPGTFTVKAGALPEIVAGTPQTLTLTPSGGANYVLKLDSTGIPIFDSTKGTPELTLSDTIATVTRTQSAGWEETTAGTTFTYNAATTPKTLATVTDLKSGVTANDVSLSGQVITLKKAALPTANITVENTNADEDKPYELALDTTAKDGSDNPIIGFETVAAKWELDSETPTTALYKSSGTAEGWTLGKRNAADTVNNQITYKDATYISTLATISNLNTNVRVKDGTIGTYADPEDDTSTFTAGITVEGNSIKLKEAVLTETAGDGNATTLEQGHQPNAEGTADASESTTYTLAKDGDIASAPAAGAITLGDNNNGTVEINQALGAYWTFDTMNNNKVTYTEASSQKLATITNLNTSAHITEYEEEVDGETVSKPADIALGGDTSGSTGEITITVGTGALTDSDSTENKTTVTKNAAETITVASTHTFKFELGTGVAVATDGNNKPTEDIRLGNLDTNSDADMIGTKKVDVVGTIPAGYSVDTGNMSITYRAAETKTLATITGLNNSLELVTSGDNEGQIGTGTGENFKELLSLVGNVVTVKGDDAIAEAKDVVLERETVEGVDTAYTLVQGAEVTEPGTTPTGMKLELKGDSTKTVDVVGTLTEGWKVNIADNGLKITYQEPVSVTLATISGIADDLIQVTEESDNKGKIGKPVDSTFKETISLGEDEETHNPNKIITLTKDALKEESVIIQADATAQGQNYDTNYTLALAEGADAPDAYGASVVANSAALSDLDGANSGKIKVTGTLAAGWDLDTTNNTIVYTHNTPGQHVATIKGLNTAIGKGGTEDNQFGVTVESNFTEAVSIDNANNVITLKNGSLTQGNVEIEKVATTLDNNPFTLALDNGIEGYNSGAVAKYGIAEGTVGFKPIYYWEKAANNTTAYYKADTAEGWKFAKDEHDNNDTTKLEYVAEKATAKTVAEIRNLQKGIAATAATVEAVAAGATRTTIDGIKVGTVNSDTFTESNDGGYDESVIQLSKNILGTTEGTNTTLTNGKEIGDVASTYTLALNSTTMDEGYVPTATEQKNVWTTVGATSIYKNVATAYWTQDATTGAISYHAQVNPTDELARITGLSADVDPATDFVITNPSKDGKGNVTTPGTIKLNAHALAGKNLTLTSNEYVFDLNRSTSAANTGKTVASTTLTNAKWTYSGTTAKYVATVSEGYELSNDGKTVIYTKAATNQTIATITGLKSGLTVNEDGTIDGITLGKDVSGTWTADANGTIIQLSKNVLGTSKVSVSGTGIGANYTLDIDSTTVPTTTDDATTDFVNEAKTAYGTPPAEEIVWRISGTTATYKKVVPAYYTLDSDNKAISYKAENATATYATVSGLKSGLTVDESTNKINGIKVGTVTSDTFTEATTAEQIAAANVIQLSGNVLGTAKVSVSVPTGGTAYTLALDSTTDLAPALESGTNYSVTQDGTTKTKAYVKGILAAGYTLSSDAKSVTYTAKNSNHTFATITGLASGLSASDISNGIVVDKSTKEINVSRKMLSDTTDAVIDETGAKAGFKFDTLDTETIPGNTVDNTPIWAVTNSTTYTYKMVQPVYYTLANQTLSGTDYADTVIDCTPQADVTNGTIATFTNFKSGLLKSDGTIDGITVASNTITVSASALDKKNATAVKGTGGTDYTITLDEDAAPTNGTPYWTLNGTTAILKQNVTDGYTLDGNSINYQTAKSGSTAVTLATITGLSGLKLKSDGTIDGITLGTLNGTTFTEATGEDLKTATVIQLSKDVLGTTDVSVSVPSNSTAYTLALDKESFSGSTADAGQIITDTVDPNSLGWEIDNIGKASLKTCATAGYKVQSDNKTIKYSGASLSGDALATVEGLKSGVTVDADKQIKGVSVNKSTGIITLAKDALGTTNVKVATAAGSATTYSLVLKRAVEDLPEGQTQDADIVPDYEYSSQWTRPSKGNATFTETYSEYWKIDNDDSYSDTYGQVIYSPKKVVTSKISGLNNNVKIVQINEVDEDGTNKTVDVVGTDATHYIKFEASDGESGGDPDTETEAETTYGSFLIQGASALLAEKTVTLTATTNRDDYKADYTLALPETDLATSDADNPKWIKSGNSTTATYTVTTQKGYRMSDDEKKILYSSTPTQKHLATIKGLEKTVAAKDGEIEGISLGDVTDMETVDGQTVTNKTRTVTLNSNVFTNTDVTITDEVDDVDYILAFGTGTNAAADPNNVSKQWYEEQDANPTWTFNKNKGTATLVSGKTESWAIKSTTTGTGEESAVTTTDPTTIVYKAATPENIATVSGLKVGSDGKVKGLELTSWTRKDNIEIPASGSTEVHTVQGGVGVIQLTADSLNKKDVTVTSADSTKYAFTFDPEGSISAPEQGDNLWTADGKGKAFYQYTTTEGYKLNESANELAYSAQATTTLATISGLNTSKVKKDTTGKATIDGIEVTVEPSTVTDGGTETITKGTINLTNDDILGKTVKITSDLYKLGLSEDVSTQPGGEKWYLSGTTATYKAFRTPGYDLDKAETTATKKAETAGNTVLTVKGLKKNLKIAAINEGGLVVNDDNTVSINDTVLGTTKVTLENGEGQSYRFDAEGFTTPEAQTPKWQFSNGTANLRQTTTKGFTLGSSDTDTDKGDVLNYSAQETVSLAKVKNLSTKLKAFENVDVTEDGVTVNKNVLGTYKTEKVNGKNTTVIDKAVVTYDEDNKIITLDEAAFNKKTVSFASNTDNYKLAFGTMGDTNTVEDTITKWTVSGTTGSFKQYTPLYYSLNEEQDTITYKKEDSPKTSIFAQVTNLKKGTTLTTQVTDGEEIVNPNFTVESKNAGNVGGVLTLYKDNLNNKSVALSGSQGYTLALGSDITGTLASAISNVSSATANSSGKAVLKGTRKAGYELAFGQRAITWISKDKENQTVATVTGLKKDANITASDGVITLDNNKVNKKTLTLTTSLGSTDYVFNADALVAPTVTLRAGDAGYWNQKSTTVSVMGAVTEGGYIAAASGKAVTYIKETATITKGEDKGKHKDVSIATIKGMKSTDVSTVDADAKTITLSGYDLDEKVTVSGGAFSFDIDGNFKDASLTGSSAADRITVAGSGLTVTGGNGDDYIDLGSGGNNTFVYANGQGNDVIAGFTPSDGDKLKITKGTIAVEHYNSDVIVKVGTGKIRLTGAYEVNSDIGGMNLTILNNKNAETTYFVPDAQTMSYPSGSSNVLLEDSNYSADAANLSDIVEPYEATYTPYDFDANSFSLTKEDKLTSAAITYSGDTNKK